MADFKGKAPIMGEGWEGGGPGTDAADPEPAKTG
jgi:hypothetical protein